MLNQEVSPIDPIMDAFNSMIGARGFDFAPPTTIYVVGDGIATPGEWRSFVGSNVWKDWEKWLRLKMEEFRDALENCPLGQIPELRGRIAAYRDMLDIPTQSMVDLTTGNKEEEDARE